MPRDGGASGLDPADEAVLRGLLRFPTLARGQLYARSGAVQSVEWDPSGLAVSGRVRGSAAEPYTVSVKLTRRADGRLRHMTGNCSCPVGHNCKHAVALLYAPGAARPPVPGSASPSASAPATGGPRPSGPVSQLAGRHPTAPGAVADGWSGPLGALVAAVGAGGEGSGDPTGAQLGLQFEVVAVRPVAGRGQDGSGGPGIRLRPVTMSDRGNWVRTGVSWSSIDYFQSWRSPRRGGPLQLLRELRALARLGDARRWTIAGEESVWLESVASRRVWDLLAEAESAGLALVGTGRGAGSVTVERQPVSTVLDVGRDPAGDLLLRAGFVTGPGTEPVGPNLLLVGQPPHGVAWWGTAPGTTPAGGGPALHLAPLDAPLPQAAAALVTAAAPLRIPESGVARFEHQMYPVLSRRLPVTSRDGTYSPPAIEADRVVCRIDHRPGPALEIAWGLVAGSGGPRAVTDAPDPAAEKAIGHVVDLLGWQDRLVGGAGGRLVPVGGRLTGMAAARFATETVPALELIEGVEIVQSGEAADYRELTDAPTVRLAAASPSAGTGLTDWLDLAVEVTVGGEKVPFEELFVALAEGHPHLLLPSGGYFSLDRDELRQLAELISEARALQDAPPSGVRLSRYDAGLLQDLAELAGADAAGWADPLLSLASGSSVPRPLPAGLVADLRPYQRDGFEWLAERFERGVGAVLADDMGLGKTLQALALICHAREGAAGPAPFLVVAPASVVGAWAGEAARFAPGLRVVVVSDTTRRRGVPVASLADGADLVITSYTLFRLDQEEFRAAEWAGLLLDEAQFVKNPASRVAQAARRFPAGWKLAMSGTPLENSLGELWSLFSITCPGLLGRPDRFDAAYRHPIERRGDAEALERLRRRLRPFMLRRTKAEVLADLPEKQEVVVEIELDPRHRRRYQTHLQRERQKLLGLLTDMKANRVAILSSLTTLRQAALDVALVDPTAHNVPSTKLEYLDTLLAEAVADGHRVLVFSQFTRFLSEARRRAEAAGIATCYLDGRTRKRAEVIERFRSEAVPVFFISLKAGGFGLTLTEADHAVLLDPWWNPATETQAIDRIHRIGQTRKVMVHRLVARDTIEEKVMALKEGKARLFDSVMGGDRFASASFTAEDIESLLG